MIARPTLRRWVTDMGEAAEGTQLDAAGRPVGDTMHVPRYGVWEGGGHHRKPEVIDTSDDLVVLCAKHGLDPADVLLIARQKSPT